MGKKSGHPPPFFECNPAVIFSDTANMFSKEEKWDYIVSLMRAWSDIDIENMPHWMYENLARVRDISAIRSKVSRQRWAKEENGMQLHTNSIPIGMQNDAIGMQSSLLFSSCIENPLGFDNTACAKKKCFTETEKPFEYATRFDKALKRELTTYKNRTPAQIQEWAAEFDRINRIDGHSWEDIARMITGILKDDFWKTNILSPAKLRKQWAEGKLNRCFEGTKDASGTQPAQQTAEERRTAVRGLVRGAMPHATDAEIEKTVEEYLRDNKN